MKCLLTKYHGHQVKILHGLVLHRLAGYTRIIALDLDLIDTFIDLYHLLIFLGHIQQRAGRAKTLPRATGWVNPKNDSAKISSTEVLLLLYIRHFLDV